VQFVLELHPYEFQPRLGPLSCWCINCNTLQHTGTHCSTLQHTATHCSTLQHTAAHCNTLQYTATHCSTVSLEMNDMKHFKRHSSQAKLSCVCLCLCAKMWAVRRRRWVQILELLLLELLFFSKIDEWYYREAKTNFNLNWDRSLVNSLINVIHPKRKDKTQIVVTNTSISTDNRESKSVYGVASWLLRISTMTVAR